MWHCPHCGAPQAETARCWVCRRSSTTCSTCRHFRTSLAVDVGYCALDRKRRPLTGMEMRGCWAERPIAEPAAGLDAAAPNATERAEHRLRLPPRDFIPVELVKARAPAEPADPPDASAPAPVFLPVDPGDAWDARTSLFGDAER
jgi:hypothetical protein